MPKNIGKGGNKRKKGKKMIETERELQYKTEMQEYGQITRLLGDSRLEVQCVDGVKRVGHIRGKIKKKVWMTTGDVVLVALREFEKEKCDVLLKYSEDEVRKLKNIKAIPENIKIPTAESQVSNQNPQDEDNIFGLGNNVGYVKKAQPASDEDEEEEDEDEEEDDDDDWITQKMNRQYQKKVKHYDDSDEEEEDDDGLDINNI